MFINNGRRERMHPGGKAEDMGWDGVGREGQCKDGVQELDRKVKKTWICARHDGGKGPDQEEYSKLAWGSSSS